MIDHSLERARLLLEQRRPKDAEKELMKCLSVDPNNSEVFMLLSICKSEDKKYEEAEQLIQNAIRLDPANSFLLYLYAQILFSLEKYKQSEEKIREAIQIDPQVPEFFGLLAAIYLNRKEWEKGLEYANKGLALDAENLTCLNLRSTALIKLDKKEESYSTINEALNYDPNNAMTHTNLGWGLLEKGDHKKALQHLKKALQVDPQYYYAKQGMVEALKSRYFIYRMFLKYSFWIGNMKSNLQWMVLIGFFLGSKIIGWISDNNPALAPYLTPIVYLYILFAVTTWIIRPLTNLFLRLNPYGRYLLSSKEILTSNFVGISLLVGILGLGLDVFLPDNGFFVVGVFGLSMMIPLSTMLNGSTPRNKRILIGYTLALAFFGILAVVLTALNLNGALLCFTIYLIGFIIYQFVANGLMM